jgi:integrase
MNFNTPLEHAVKTSQRLSTKTREIYLRHVQDFIAFTGPNPRNWTTYRLEQWRDHLTAERKLKPKSVNLYLAAVAFAAKRYNQLGHGPDFARATERMRVVNTGSTTGALTLKESKRLVAACSGRTPPDLRDRAMILIGLHAAFRRESLISITFAGCERNNISAIVKGGKLHTVKIGSEPWAALRDWTGWLNRNGIGDGLVFRNLRPSIEGGYRIGDSISADGFARILSARAEAAGLENVHPHKLRHTFTSLALQAGVPLWRVQKVLGHKSQTMHYAVDLEDDPIGAEFPVLME